MKDFAKSIRTMNSNKEEIIKKKKQEGATLKVDNGQKLEFSDGTTFVKTSFSDDYREAKNYMGNSKVGNADPRIASLKTKLQNLAKQGDEGAIKDVERFVEDMIKELNKRKEDLYKEINKLEEDRQGYLDLRGEVMSARYEATHLKK